MSEVLYDRYKEALRRGHVNALRGRLEQAAVAYDEAATIAPERALPHTSLGSVFMKLGRTEDAVAAFSTALDRAPRDETALQGRADALAELGRRAEAAEAYGVLAEVLDGAGRAAEALDTARRAIELAESKELRRHLESLAVRLREGQPDDAAQAALDRASAVLAGRSPGDGASLRTMRPSPRRRRARRSSRATRPRCADGRGRGRPRCRRRWARARAADRARSRQGGGRPARRRA